MRLAARAVRAARLAHLSVTSCSRGGPREWVAVHRILRMDSTRRRQPIASLAIAAMLVAAQSAADAQVINRCRIDGRLVIQAAPCPLDPPMLTSSTTPTTTPAAAAASGPKKKTLADMLRERDGVAQRPMAREEQGDGANILRSRMGAV